MVEGLLLDSGDTIIGPRGGRWNPRFDFEDVLLRHWPDAPVDCFPEAFAAGQQFMNDFGSTPPRELYHRAVLRHLGMSDPSQSLLNQFDSPLPLHEVVEVFPDVRPALDQLQTRGVRMVIVSDNWSGLDQIYEQLGLRDYFEAFIVSEELGCCKPDPRMFQAGSDALGLAPGQCLFVDDDPELVAAALGLGYGGAAIDRNGAGSTEGVPTVASLAELVHLI